VSDVTTLYSGFAPLQITFCSVLFLLIIRTLVISKSRRNGLVPHYVSTVQTQKKNLHRSFKSNLQVALCLNMLYFGNEFVSIFSKHLPLR